MFVGSSIVIATEYVHSVRPAHRYAPQHLNKVAEAELNVDVKFSTIVSLRHSKHQTSSCDEITMS